MVKILKKKLKKEVFANGRIVVTDLEKLKKEDFPQYNSGDMLFLHYDGKIYIDSNNDGNEAIVMLLKMLVQLSYGGTVQNGKGKKKEISEYKDSE